MMRQLVLLLLGLNVFIQAHAFPCYITLIKSNCWSDYTASVDVMNVLNNNILTTIVVPNGQNWTRFKFSCQPQDTFLFKARFSPVIWETDAKKAYLGKRFWSFPEAIKPGESAWNMTICYSNDFEGVPMPPVGGQNCTCSTEGLPVIEPEVVAPVVKHK